MFLKSNCFRSRHSTDHAILSIVIKIQKGIDDGKFCAVYF